MVPLALLLVVGCSEPDGAPCEEPDDCASDVCNDGYCGGSECSDTDDHCDCEEGWQCTYIPPSELDKIGAAIGGAFGGDGEADGHHRCRATCGHCPPNQHCADPSDVLCSHGAP